jgi:hypothetical protein
MLMNIHYHLVGFVIICQDAHTRKISGARIQCRKNTSTMLWVMNSDEVFVLID